MRYWASASRPWSSATPASTFASRRPRHAKAEPIGFREAFLLTSFRDRNLFAACQAGLVNNLNDGMSWAIFPLFFAARGLGVEPIGVLKAVYPGVWGVLQIVTGPLSDRIGRKGLIVAGMWLQAAALLMVPLLGGFAWWLVASILLGLGTAMVYPTLLAAISDVAHPTWRARSLSIYRFWRDWDTPWARCSQASSAMPSAWPGPSVASACSPSSPGRSSPSRCVSRG